MSRNIGDRWRGVGDSGDGEWILENAGAVVDEAAVAVPKLDHIGNSGGNTEADQPNCGAGFEALDNKLRPIPRRDTRAVINEEVPANCETLAIGSKISPGVDARGQLAGSEGILDYVFAHAASFRYSSRSQRQKR